MTASCYTYQTDGFLYISIFNLQIIEFVDYTFPRSLYSKDIFEKCVGYLYKIFLVQVLKLENDPINSSSYGIGITCALISLAYIPVMPGEFQN